jgi:hypothetical protein
MGIQQTASKTVKVTFLGLNSAARVHANHMYFQYGGDDITGSEAADLAQKASTIWQDEILDILSASYTYTGAQFIDLDDADGVTGHVSPTAAHPTAGQVPGTPGAPQVCILVKKNIAGSGRGARPGRMYLSPINESEIDGTGTIDPATVTAWTTKVQAARTAWEALEYGAAKTIALVQPHWRLADKPETEDGIWASTGWSDLLSLSVDNRVATQRRRVRG